MGFSTRLSQRVCLPLRPPAWTKGDLGPKSNQVYGKSSVWKSFAGRPNLQHIADDGSPTPALPFGIPSGITTMTVIVLRLRVFNLLFMGL